MKQSLIDGTWDDTRPENTVSEDILHPGWGHYPDLADDSRTQLAILESENELLTRILRINTLTSSNARLRRMVLESNAG